MTDERVWAAERRAQDAEQRAANAEKARRDAEIIAAEKQRDAEAIAKKYAEKRRAKNWFTPIIGADDSDE